MRQPGERSRLRIADVCLTFSLTPASRRIKMAGYEASPATLQCMATVSWPTFKLYSLLGQQWCFLGQFGLPRLSHLIKFQIGRQLGTMLYMGWPGPGWPKFRAYLWYLQIPTVTLHTVRMSVKTKYASGSLVTPGIGRTHWCHQMFRFCSTESLFFFFRWKCIFLHSLTYSEAEKLGDFVKLNFHLMSWSKPEVAFLQHHWPLETPAAAAQRFFQWWKSSGKIDSTVEALTPSTFSCLPQSCMAPGEILDG